MDQKQPLLESDEGFIPPVAEQRLKRNIISLSLAVYSFLVSIVLITMLSSGSQSCDDVSLARPKCKVSTLFHYLSIASSFLTIPSDNQSRSGT
jgi:hypothetical protein